MSCRVVRPDAPATKPLFPPQAAAKPSPTATPFQQRRPNEPDAAAELETLRSRIRDLEHAIAEKTDQAKRAGFQEGEAAGFERATTEHQPVLDKLARTIAEIGGLRARIREETESDLVSLSVGIARRILRRELTIDPDAIQGLIRTAIEKLGNRDITSVRLYPPHEAAVRQCLASIGGASIEITRDPGLQPGDVIFETKRGNLDISIDTQLAEIERGFADRMSR